MDKHLFVAYAVDDHFAEILGVSLTSLYENNKRMKQITVYILEDDISKENKEKIETMSICQSIPRKTLIWICGVLQAYVRPLFNSLILK